jgi:DNA polymerase
MIYRREITRKNKKERHFGKTAILGLGFGVGFMTFALQLRKKLRFTPDEVREVIGAEYDKLVLWVEKRLNPRPEYFGNIKIDAVAKSKYKGAVLIARRLKAAIAKARTTPDEMKYELALCKYVVDLYRAQYPEVPELWAAEEADALAAVHSPGQQFGRWVVEGRFLNCYLDTGRPLHYCDTGTEKIKTPWGAIKEQVTYYGVAKKGSKKWQRMHLYGSMEVENITQATAREVMASAFVRAVEYDPSLTVHDELLVEVDEGEEDVPQFELFMARPLQGLDGCPIVAEGAIMRRFRK